jgi:hypothetical protein
MVQEKEFFLKMKKNINTAHNACEMLPSKLRDELTNLKKDDLISHENHLFFNMFFGLI